MLRAEYEFSKKTTPSASASYYILSVDVGRKGCESVVCVFRVTPSASAGPAFKSLVNIYTFSDEHFGDQAVKIKRLFYDYKARKVVIDANGLGIGLIDYMVQESSDPLRGVTYPNFGVENDPDGFYKRFKNQETEQEAMYLLKADAPLNTEAHANAQTQLIAGKVRLLIDERTAKNNLLGTKIGREMTAEERANRLKPFTDTSILREEMLNLHEENEGVNIILKQANKRVPKDTFSSFEYGL